MRHRVADAHGGHRRDLRERARDDDRAPFVHVRHRGRVVRVVDVVVIRLVDQHRHAGGQAVEQLLDFLLGDDHAGRVVRVAEVDEPDLAGALLRHVDDLVHVLAEVGRQRQLDRLGLDGRRVLVDRVVGRLDAEHLLAAEEERGADDLEHLAGAGGEHHVLRLDAVELRNRLLQAGARIAVAAGVLPGAFHRLHHRVGNAPVVLVAGELRHRVVLLRGLRTTHAPAPGPAVPGQRRAPARTDRGRC